MRHRREIQQEEVAEIWLWLMGFSWLLMWLLYLPLFRSLGGVAGGLGCVPVALSGALGGMRWGGFSALVAFGSQLSLLLLGGYNPWGVDASWGMFWGGFLILLWVGISVGRMRELRADALQRLQSSQKNAHALRKLEARNRALLCALPDTLYRVSHKGQVWRIAPLCVEEGGKAEDEESAPWEGENKEKIFEKIALVLQSQKMQCIEFEEGKGERRRDLEARIVASRQHEALVIVRDITERKELERALYRTREEALKGEQERSAFLAWISHEIRTPLHGMLTALELLNNERRQLDDKELLAIVHQSGKLLQELVDDVLDFSKLEAGRITFEVIEFHLPNLLEELVLYFSPQAHRKGIRLLSLVDPDVPRSLWSDPLRLRQVLMNFLSNALKFTEVGEVEVSARLEAGRLLIATRDTGLGIEEAALQRLFSAFAQAEASTSRQFGGTGLGLVIAKQLVEKMGGRIQVTSEVGVGSTFEVSFPLRVVSENDLTVPQQGVSSLPGLFVTDGEEVNSLLLSGLETWYATPRVLLVDAHAKRRAWAARMLRVWGCLCEEAASFDAVEMHLRSAAHRANYSLLWLDHNPPHLNALDWLTKQHASASPLPPCLLTIERGLRLPQSITQQKNIFLLPKPYRQHDLRQAISILLWQSCERLETTTSPTSFSTDGALAVQSQPTEKSETSLPQPKAAHEPNQYNLTVPQETQARGERQRQVEGVELEEPKMQKTMEIKSLRGSSGRTQESEEHTRIPQATSEESHFDHPLILLVEDNPLNQRVMEMTLAQFNCRTIIARDGREAIQKLTQSPTDFFDLVLMDCQMPELDGYQTTALIRQQLGMKDLPIIGSSASHLEEDRLRALAAGMDDYLAKPIRKENLQQILTKWRRTQKENLLGQE